MQEQNAIIQRPFSAAMPLVKQITQAKKKTVMFEENLKEETEIEIMNDEDEYVQFNSGEQMATPPLIESKKELPPKIPAIRPVTAIPQRKLDFE